MTYRFRVLLEDVERLGKIIIRKNDNKLLAEGYTVNVFVNTKTMKSTKIPEELRKSLENDILLDRNFRQLQEDYYEAKKKAEKAKVVREAFMQRKEMIRGLIELHNSTYFSRVETKTDKSARESYDNEKLKRRTRGK